MARKRKENSDDRQAGNTLKLENNTISDTNISFKTLGDQRITDTRIDEALLKTLIDIKKDVADLETQLSVRQSTEIETEIEKIWEEIQDNSSKNRKTKILASIETISKIITGLSGASQVLKHLKDFVKLIN